MHSAVLQSSAESLSHSEHTVQPEQLLLYKGCCARLQTYLDSLKLLECVQAHARPHVHSFVYYRGHWSSARSLQSSDLQPAFTGTLFPSLGHHVFKHTHFKSHVIRLQLHALPQCSRLVQFVAPGSAAVRSTFH